MRYLQVVKIGTSSVFNNGAIDYLVLSNLGYGVTKLRFERETSSVLVVSGAILLGMGEKGFAKKPDDKMELQSCARVGQPKLMDAYDIGLRAGYDRYSKEKGLSLRLLISQVLPTYHQLDNTAERRNIVAGLLHDANQGIIPLINYNDGVDPTEVTRDNDNLAARIAKTLVADRLVILTDVDGLLDADGRLVRRVSEINDDVRALCNGNGNGTGGMKTKLEAADLLLKEGIPTIIGNSKYGLLKLIENEDVRTLISR